MDILLIVAAAWITLLIIWVGTLAWRTRDQWRDGGESR